MLKCFIGNKWCSCIVSSEFIRCGRSNTEPSALVALAQRNPPSLWSLRPPPFRWWWWWWWIDDESMMAMLAVLGDEFSKDFNLCLIGQRRGTDLWHNIFVRIPIKLKIFFARPGELWLIWSVRKWEIGCYVNRPITSLEGEEAINTK